MTLRRRWAVRAAGVVAIAALGGCAPLPGNSLDPLYLKVGDTSTLERPAEATEPSPSAAKPPPKQEVAVATPSVPTTSPRVWAGRYRDSRGEGEVTFFLVQSRSLMSGTWKARAGGGGPVTATAEAQSQRWQFRMENSAAECPGTFEGWLESRGGALVGTYRGNDCEGAIFNGALELSPK